MGDILMFCHFNWGHEHIPGGTPLSQKSVLAYCEDVQAMLQHGMQHGQDTHIYIILVHVDPRVLVSLPEALEPIDLFIDVLQSPP